MMIFDMKVSTQLKTRIQNIIVYPIHWTQKMIQIYSHELLRTITNNNVVIWIVLPILETTCFK